jgi:hypothetical protein
VKTTREFRDYLVDHWRIAAQTKELSRVDSTIMHNIISNLCSDIEELEKKVEGLTKAQERLKWCLS